MTEDSIISTLSALRARLSRAEAIERHRSFLLIAKQNDTRRRRLAAAMRSVLRTRALIEREERRLSILSRLRRQPMSADAITRAVGNRGGFR